MLQVDGALVEVEVEVEVRRTAILALKVGQLVPTEMVAGQAVKAAPVAWLSAPLALDADGWLGPDEVASPPES